MRNWRTFVIALCTAGSMSAHAANQESKTVYVGEAIKKGDSLAVKQAFGGFSEFKKKNMDKLKITFEGLGRAGEATLLINGKQAGNVKSYQGKAAGEQKLTWNPGKEFVVGSGDIKTVKIQFSTRVFVKEAKAVFNDPTPQSSSQAFQLNKKISGEEYLDLAQEVYADYDQYSTKVDKIKIRIQNVGRRAQFKLCIKGFNYNCSYTKLVTANGVSAFEIEPPKKNNGKAPSFGELELMARGTFILKRMVVNP